MIYSVSRPWRNRITYFESSLVEEVYTWMYKSEHLRKGDNLAEPACLHISWGPKRAVKAYPFFLSAGQSIVCRSFEVTVRQNQNHFWFNSKFLNHQIQTWLYVVRIKISVKWGSRSILMSNISCTHLSNASSLCISHLSHAADLDQLIITSKS